VVSSLEKYENFYANKDPRRVAGSIELPSPDLYQRIIMLERLFKNRPRGIILDIGSGPGILAAKVAIADNDRVILTDASLNAMQLAASIFAKRRLSGDFVVCDSISLPFKDNSVSSVMCLEVLEHLDSDLKALREITRVMMRNSQVLISCPNLYFPFLLDPKKKLQSTRGELKDLDHIGNYSPFFGPAVGHKRLYTKAKISTLADSCQLRVVDFATTGHELFVTILILGKLAVRVISRNPRPTPDNLRASPLAKALARVAYFILRIENRIFCRTKGGLNLHALLAKS
jgi:2-polyprenyl-3-methyl-5-hydroxy-6-metoxy-1,4-benzoquinol methylase